ncbi:mitochondrial ATP-independent inner membrane protease subunit 2-like isoform X2 [Silene latifolia]|uniref:mitochondrial ATP-independent inner membrane protease subunit 2-like isoform X2 n=1 Tax=Silene latifolia TaxID=37657 RepID=UPI003D785A93
MEKHQAGQIASKDVWSTVYNNMFTKEMLYLYRSKDLEMAPTITPEDTLVIRRFPTVNSSSHPLVKEHLPQINVGDVVVLQDPSNSKNYIIRRLAAVEGHEMVSTNEDDEPFVIEEGQGWVLADKKSLSPKESKDSRTYGPISMSDIVGRIVYRFRTLDDHGFMRNNKLSRTYDMPILYMELDSEVMLRFADEGKQTKSSKD